jgi:pimeloyl-ACP methyl ester carboxylesterase
MRTYKSQYIRTVSAKILLAGFLQLIGWILVSFSEGGICMSRALPNSRLHALCLTTALVVSTAACSWNGGADSSTRSLSDLALGDSRIILAGANGCPSADATFVGGCLRVPERRDTADSTMLQIFFQYVNEPKDDRETIVVLNGGPGASLTCYSNVPQILKLSERYNVLFYDPRGVARSSAITSANVASLDPYNYGTPENSADLSDLVSHVVRKPVILLGHSYGAHLGFAFSVQHPEQVKAYIDSNGASDNLGFLLQPGRKSSFINKGVREVEGEKLDALVKLIQQGKAHDASGKVISMEEIAIFMSLAVSSFKGQQTGIKDYFDALFAANSSEIAKLLAEGTVRSREESAEQKSTRLDFVPGEGINPYVNKGIVCGEMYREESFSVLNESDKNLVQQAINALCAGLPKAPASRIFDAKPLLYKIKTPVLIVSGDSDPLVAPETQKRDFEILKALGANVSLWTFQNTGHQIFFESPKCTEKVLNEFLARIGTGEDPGAREDVCIEESVIQD